MRKKTFFVLSILLAAGTVTSQTYTESPATGEFTSDADVGGNYDYKAGEFTVEAEGVLPPTNEKLVITSYGQEEGWKEINAISGLTGENWFWYSFSDTLYEEYYYAWQPGKPGLYKFRINATLTSVTKGEYVTNYDDWHTESHRTSFKMWKDERGVCNPSMYDGMVTMHETYDGDDYYFDVWSEKCGYYDSSPSTFNPEPREQDLDFEPSRYGPDDDKDNVWDYTDVNGENSETLAEWSVDPPGVEQPDSGSATNTSTKTFVENRTIRMYNQEVESVSDDRRNNTVLESFHVSMDKVGKITWPGCDYDCSFEEALEGSMKINDFSTNYIDPIGNTVVKIGDKWFTGDIQTVSDYSTTLGPGTDGWQNTSRSVNLDLEGPFENQDYENTKKIIVKGEYKAISPPGTSPEAYRWVKKGDTSEVLVNYTSFSSGSESDYHDRKTVIDTDNTQVESGEYILQVKSSSDNYEVAVGLRDFQLKTDDYIRVGESRTFNPQLELGYNTVEIFTSNANNLGYSYTWDECHNPVGAISPGNESMVDEVDPTLELTNNCNSVDEISFRDARTDAVIRKFEDVANGERLTAETDLNIGDTYRWYVRFCDQEVCYSTDVYEFTVGQRDPESGQVTVEESTSQGLEYVVRDEDFNPYGQPNKSNETLADNLPGDKKLGYINKLEEESDQLEPGMATAALESERDRIWVNSQGGNDSADQWGIAPYPNWSISNRGNPYPPWGTYYRDEGERRASTNSPTSRKTSKVFANSLAVVAAEDVTDSEGNLIAREGAGVWIDPDNIEWTRSGAKYEYTKGDWEELLEFNMDLTGPDSGIGYDAGDGAAFQPLGDEDDPSRKSVIKADIYFKGENN